MAEVAAGRPRTMGAEPSWLAADLMLWANITPAGRIILHPFAGLRLRDVHGLEQAKKDGREAKSGYDFHAGRSPPRPRPLFGDASSVNLEAEVEGQRGMHTLLASLM